jgi:hypothetical protein
LRFNDVQARENGAHVGFTGRLASFAVHCPLGWT